MRYILSALFVLLLQQVSAPVQAATGRIEKDLIRSGGRERAYYLFVPEGVTAAKPAPLVLMLHGSGRNGLPLVEKWKDLAAKERIILVGPDATDPSHWDMQKDGPDFLHELVESVRSTYPVNPRRIYLFGHSAGAIYGLYVSMLESEYFAATAVHAGAMNKDDSSLVGYARRKIPIAITVGTVDPYFPLSAVRATRDLLTSNGFAVELTEIPNHNHDYYSHAAEINRAMWAFLQKHELAGDPRYEEFNRSR